MTTARDKTVANPDAHDRPLPPGWERARLGDVCERFRRTIKPNDAQASTYPYLRLEHIESQTGRIAQSPADLFTDTVKSNTFAFRPGHVLYGKLRPYLNKVAIADFEGRCTSEIVPLLPKGLTSEYLAMALRRNETVEHVMRATTGSRMPRADMAHLMSMSIPVPPLPEQKRIVRALQERMEAIDSAKRAAEAELDAANAMSAAYLRQVFPAEGEELPSGWEWVRLGDVCEVNPRKPVTLNRNDDVLTTFIPMSAINVDEGLFIQPEQRVFGQVRRGYSYFEEGDVLFAKITPCMQNGKHFIAKGLIDGIGFGTTELHVIRPSDSMIAEWVHSFLRQPSVLLWAAENFRGSAGQQRVPAECVSNLRLPAAPIPEQERIIRALKARMDAIESLRQSVNAQLITTAAMFDSYLRAAFNGSLV